MRQRNNMYNILFKQYSEIAKMVQIFVHKIWVFAKLLPLERMWTLQDGKEFFCGKSVLIVVLLRTGVFHFNEDQIYQNEASVWMIIVSTCIDVIGCSISHIFCDLIKQYQSRVPVLWRNNKENNFPLCSTVRSCESWQTESALKGIPNFI